MIMDRPSPMRFGDAADPAGAWLGRLEERHLARLTFQEVRRGLQALSSAYVERRDTAIGSALQGAGKRAAFALFYGTLHFLLVRRVVQSLRDTHSSDVSSGWSAPALRRIVDLGCGTGAAGAAWALEAGPRVRLTGVERDRWAAGEAAWSYRTLDIRGSVRVADLRRAPLPGSGAGVLLAFTVNELGEADRSRLLDKVLASARSGAAILVVEPISQRAAPWWQDWASAFQRAGGRADRWRFETDLPAIIARLDAAAGLDHRTLSGRSLWLPAS